MSQDKVIQSGDLCNLFSSLQNTSSVNDPDIPHIVQGVCSQLNPYYWNKMLFPSESSGDPDALFLMDGVLHGFKLVDSEGMVGPYYTENYRSTIVASRDEMDELMATELRQGQMSIVADKPRCIHAMGAIKKPSGKIRNMTDCSKP